MREAKTRATVVGAGIGGLVCAIEMAAAGMDVTVFERADCVGGRMRELPAGGDRIDAGPTVMTMRWIFDDLFARTGRSLDSVLTLDGLEILARHAWEGPRTLDLYADPTRSAEAIGTLCGKRESAAYLAFSRRARQTFELLDPVFLQQPRPSLGGLLAAPSPARMFALWQSKPFSSLWRLVCQHFQDARLRQLFGRYATYCGSSPFLAPATLSLIAHVEQLGVWSVAGGMQRLADALATRLVELGGRLELGCEVRTVKLARDAVSRVELADGADYPADIVVANTEPWAVAAGHLGAEVQVACGAPRPLQTSLSAVTWTCRARADGWPLTRHNVLFSADYPAEFSALGAGQYPQDPTIYLCAQDRPVPGTRESDGYERVFILMNAPAHPATAPEPGVLEAMLQRRLTRAGLALEMDRASLQIVRPVDFAQRFPGSHGALYGMATHGWRAAFQRRDARTAVKGFYLCGGGVHPGAGVPMAALSGRHAAARAVHDQKKLSRGVAMDTPARLFPRTR
jgi:1-hydroxycarotenoid 3,4-desaturase